MARLVVLGAGVMGSAFTKPAIEAGHAVTLVGSPLDDHVVDALAQGLPHPGLKVALSSRLQTISADRIAKAFSEKPDLVVLGVSSPGVDWALEALNRFGCSSPVIVLTKGLDLIDGQIRVYPERLSKRLGVPVGAIGGPCIAGELAVGRHTSVVVGFDDLALANSWAEALAGSFYHIRPTSDLVGLELCAALKNFMALGIGAAQGWLERADATANSARAHNLAAGLFSQSVRELGLLVDGLGGTVDSVMGLPGVGDLYVTVQGGRNSRMGHLLGAGWCYSKAKKERMPDDTVEGAALALQVGPTMRQMLKDGRLDAAKMPLTCAILDAVIDDQEFVMDWQRYHHA